MNYKLFILSFIFILISINLIQAQNITNFNQLNKEVSDNNEMYAQKFHNFVLNNITDPECNDQTSIKFHNDFEQKIRSFYLKEIEENYLSSNNRLSINFLNNLSSSINISVSELEILAENYSIYGCNQIKDRIKNDPEMKALRQQEQSILQFQKDNAQQDYLNKHFFIFCIVIILLILFYFLYKRYKRNKL